MNNVQKHEDVYDLPWREAFDMTEPSVETVHSAPARRRADTRTLSDVVADIALESAA